MGRRERGGRFTYNKQSAQNPLERFERCIDCGSPRISGNNQHMRREKGKEKKQQKQKKKKKKRKIPKEKQKERDRRRRIKQELCLNYARRNNLQSARSAAQWNQIKQ